MKNVLIGLVVIIVIAVAGFYAWRMFNSKPVAPVTPEAVTDTRSTYATSTYSVKYPGNFALNAQYAYDQFGPGKLIRGVKFAVPPTMATGTNLSADSGISIEQLPRAKNCTGDIYLMTNVTAQEVIENGVTYSFTSSSGAAAGNMYEERVYALTSSSPCTAVRYFIHSTNIGNYPAGAVREFDRAAVLSSFDAIRASLVLQ